MEKEYPHHINHITPHINSPVKSIFFSFIISPLNLFFLTKLNGLRYMPVLKLQTNSLKIPTFSSFWCVFLVFEASKKKKKKKEKCLISFFRSVPCLFPPRSVTVGYIHRHQPPFVPEWSEVTGWLSAPALRKMTSPSLSHQCGRALRKTVPSNKTQAHQTF